MKGRTKIICTIGPASDTTGSFTKLVESGLDVARINCSHGTHDEHRHTIEMIKQVRDKTGTNIGILLDLSGPKIRTGVLPDEGVELSTGSRVYLYPEGATAPGSSPSIPVQYPHLLQDAHEGATILMDDGHLALSVEKCGKDCVTCLIVEGGVLRSHKGVNFPGASLTLGAPTEKDLDDLRFGIEQGVDFVALSFVQSPEDIRTLKKEMKRLGASVPVIAKIERGVAMERIDEITAVSDGVMVARGDLGVESDIALVPIYQKQIVRKSIRRGVPVIVATQMLESMVDSPLPTRAEANDVANAVYDEVDAVMLSEETAVGHFPVQAVHTMQRICENVESDTAGERASGFNRLRMHATSSEMAVARSVCLAAHSLSAAGIIAHTMSGTTAKLIAQNRPDHKIIAITPNAATHRRLALVWGVDAVMIPGIEDDFMATLKKSDRILMEQGVFKKGDLVVVTAGIPEGKAGGTNIMKVHTVGSDV